MFLVSTRLGNHQFLHSVEFLLDMHILLHLQGQLTPSVKCRGFKCEACHSWGSLIGLVSGSVMKIS